MKAGGAVAIRRKADGKWLGKGGGSIGYWSAVPALLKSESKAVMVIRCDLGLDLGDFDIVPERELPR